MKILCLFLGVLIPFAASAQTKTEQYRSSLTVGVEYLALDAPDDLGWRYTARYSRHLANDRLALSATTGYGRTRNERTLTGTQYITGRPRERLTLDATLAFDFIRHPRHALRLGGGPSLWYRDEDRLLGALYTLRGDGTITNVRPTWQRQTAWDAGYNLLAEYEFAVTERWLASGNFKFAQIRGFQNSLLGLGVGYRLR